MQRGAATVTHCRGYVIRSFLQARLMRVRTCRSVNGSSYSCQDGAQKQCHCSVAPRRVLWTPLEPIPTQKSLLVPLSTIPRASGEVHLEPQSAGRFTSSDIADQFWIPKRQLFASSPSVLHRFVQFQLAQQRQPRCIASQSRPAAAKSAQWDCLRPPRSTTT